MLPRLSTSAFVSSWLLLMLGASVLSLLTGGWIAEWVALAPHRIWRGEIWRLGTWALLETAPYTLVIACASIYKFGGELAPRWGDRRLRRFMLHVVLGAAIATVLGALVSQDAMHMSRTAGWAIDDALVIAWARQYPNDKLELYGLLTLSGTQLIAITVGVTVLFAIAAGPFVMMPELFACVAAAYYPRRWLAR